MASLPLVQALLHTNGGLTRRIIAAAPFALCLALWTASASAQSAKSVDLAELCLQPQPSSEAVQTYCTLIKEYGLGNIPDLVPVRIARGNAFSSLGRIDEALAEFDAALALDPSAKDALILRGATYAYLGKNDHALTDFETVIRQDPQAVDLLVQVGGQMKKKRHYGVAILFFSAALAHRPNDAQVLRDRGVAHTYDGDVPAALADLDAAIALNPRDPSSRLSRAYVRKRADDDAGALADFQAVLDASPRHSWAIYRRGHVHFDAGRFDAAIEDFKTHRQLSPDNPYGAIWLFLAQMRGGKDGHSELARFAAGASLGQWPGAIIEMYLGRLKPEIALDAAVDTDERKDLDQTCEALFYIGQHYLLQGDRERATSLFRATVEMGVTDFIEHDMAKFKLRRLIP